MTQRTLSRFAQLLLKIAGGRREPHRITADEMLGALDESFPKARRLAFQPQLDLPSQPPPVDIPGVEWRNGAFRPKTVEEVQLVVTYAAAHTRRVRVGGSQHSVPGAIFGTGSRDLRVILDGTLRYVEFISNEPSGAVVKVGAGCYLGVNPADPSSTWDNSLNGQLDAAGFALPTLGGISHQTVSGFLQTSSSGGSLARGFALAVQAIELVDGKGEVQWLNVGTDAFDAAAVSMGLFGVITHVLLACEPRYYVEGNESNFEERDSLLHKDQSGHYPLESALASTEYLHLNWFPQKGVRRVTEWRGTRTAVQPPDDPYQSALKNKLMNVLAAAVLEIISGIQGIDPNGPVAQFIIAELLKMFVPIGLADAFHYKWLQVLPCDDQVEVDTLIRIIFTEIWLPIDQLTTAVDRLNTIVEDQRVAGNFAIEFYGSQQSPFWLSPSFERDVVRVDVFWWAYSFGDPRKHFANFWNVLLDLPGARLHWGKHLPDVGQTYGNVVFGPEFLKQQYPRLPDWLLLRHDSDPDGVFVTDYWRTILGL